MKNLDYPVTMQLYNSLIRGYSSVFDSKCCERGKQTYFVVGLTFMILFQYFTRENEESRLSCHYAAVQQFNKRILQEWVS